MTEPGEITIRHLSPGLIRRLKAVAEVTGESLDVTITRLLDRAVGVADRRDRLLRWPTWSDEDSAEFEVALKAQRVNQGDFDC